MQKTVYLICGVSGAGKTWVCEQLQEKFHYIPHDKYFDKVVRVIVSCETLGKPIITECPFGERVMREDLEKANVKVIPYFVIEPPHKVRERYLAREKKPLPAAANTRAQTIMKRVQEWKAPWGPSEMVLKMLQEVAI